jgi:hypothetical protein
MLTFVIWCIGLWIIFYLASLNIGFVVAIAEDYPIFATLLTFVSLFAWVCLFAWIIL